MVFGVYSLSYILVYDAIVSKWCFVVGAVVNYAGCMLQGSYDCAVENNMLLKY